MDIRGADERPKRWLCSKDQAAAYGPLSILPFGNLKARLRVTHESNSQSRAPFSIGQSYDSLLFALVHSSQSPIGLMLDGDDPSPGSWRTGTGSLNMEDVSFSVGIAPSKARGIGSFIVVGGTAGGYTDNMWCDLISN